MNSSGVYDINAYNSISNNTTIFSTLNVSGTTILNYVINNDSLNSTSIFNNNTTINGTLNVSVKTLLNNHSTGVGTLNISGYTNVFVGRFRRYKL